MRRHGRDALTDAGEKPAVPAAEDTPAVGSDAGAVEPAAAHNGHAPLALGAGTQHRERVVAQDDGLRPPLTTHLARDAPVVKGQVGPGEAIDADVRERQ